MANEWDEAWTDEYIFNIWSPCLQWENPDPERQVILEKMKGMNSILDIGCGGAVLRRWVPDSVLYVGVDNSKKMVKCAQLLFPGVSILEWPAHELPFVDRLFECSLLKHVLEHQSLSRFDDVIRQATRVSDKRVIISSFNLPFAENETVIHMAGPNDCFYNNILGEKFLETTIGKYGFGVIEKDNSVPNRSTWVCDRV